MPNYGHEFDLPQGGEVRVRRCFEDINDLDSDARVKEVVEFTVETFHPYWSLTSLILTPAEAALYGSALICEATKELKDAA